MGKIDCVTILAGGGGTRLWPASTAQQPKQFMRVGTDKSLLLQSLERSWSLRPELGVVVVCNNSYTEKTLAEVALLPQSQAQKTYVLSEPCMRNTAAALFYANQLIEQLAGAAAINLVQTSDHLIGAPATFVREIMAAASLAAEQKIVVFGICPLHAATGYGYIAAGAALPQSGFEVLRFTEKPDLATAKKFLASGTYYWNSGMFCYSVALFRTELCALTPEIPALLGAASSNLPPRLTNSSAAFLLSPEAALEEAYHNCPNISVDYAVMEKTNKLALLPASFDWNDIGSWDALATLEANSEPLIEVGSSGHNFVRSSRPVVLCNVSNLIVVEENGVLLICQKGASELVKEARARFEKN